MVFWNILSTSLAWYCRSALADISFEICAYYFFDYIIFERQWWFTGRYFDTWLQVLINNRPILISIRLYLNSYEHFIRPIFLWTPRYPTCHSHYVFVTYLFVNTEIPDEHDFITTVESCWKSMKKSLLFILLSIMQIALFYDLIVIDPNRFSWDTSSDVFLKLF